MKKQIQDIYTIHKKEKIDTKALFAKAAKKKKKLKFKKPEKK